MYHFMRSVCVAVLCFTELAAQEPVTAANRFLVALTAAQQTQALFPFDTEERYNFHFVPKNNRKGIAIGDLNPEQYKAAMNLVRSCMSEQGAAKLSQVIALENILKQIERRDADDDYRDPRKYYFSIFGVPGDKNIWGWRIEGHHISFNFSVNGKTLVAGTPGFLGANPAIVKEGPEKGKQVLKDETEIAFSFINSLSKDHLQKAVAGSVAPGDILTSSSRKAMITTVSGLAYADMNSLQQQQLLTLIHIYVHRFTKLFADGMLKEIQQAGLENLRFTWAGSTEAGAGRAHYYRIQGPTLIIEYDNSQNNANHIHTVVRDLKHDFGGDLLLGHYRSSH